MKIKNLVLILALCFVACFSAKAYAEERGTCGDNLTWVLDDEGTLTISGTGKMDDFDITSGEVTPWDYQDVKKLVIEDGVESIGEYAFSSCYEMNDVEIANSVETIQKGAFLSCMGLEEISLPDRITYIGESAFATCDSLRSIKLPYFLTEIGMEAFDECKMLPNINIPGNVTLIGESAFNRCPKMTAINVSADNEAFSSANGVLFDKDKKVLIRYPEGKTGSYTIPNGVETIGKAAFENCIVTKIDMPAGIKKIESFAFYETKNITALAFSSGLTEMEGYLFSNTNIKSIEIPASLEILGEYSLFECDKLTDIYYYGSETQWKALLEVDDATVPDGVVVHYDYKKQYPQTITAANKTIAINTKPFNLGARVSGKGKELGKLTYVSSAKSVATVSATGVITPKGYGKTTITIKAAQTDSSKEVKKTVTITVLPRKMTLGTPKSPAKKTIQLKWTKDKTVTGYQVNLCQKNNFKTGTLSRTFGVKVVKTKIYPVKKKTWYVRIRAYKTVGKTKFFGAWSTVKKVKVK